MNTNLKNISVIEINKNYSCLELLLKKLKGKKVAISIIGQGGKVYLYENFYFCESLNYQKQRLLSEIIDLSYVDNLVTKKVVQEGIYYVSGANSPDSLKSWIEKLKKYDIELIITDIPLSRLSFSSPSICDSIILSVKANSQEDIAKASNIMKLINLDLASDDKIWKLHSIGKGVFAINKDLQLEFLSNTSLEIKEMRELKNYDSIYIAGVLIDSFLDKMIQQRKGIEIIVKDFTNVVASNQKIQEFTDLGGKIHVLKKSKSAEILMV